jgi:hypothetical protein
MELIHPCPTAHCRTESRIAFYATMKQGLDAIRCGGG